MDELSPTAQLVGAINTIVNKDGKLYGDSTDGTGFMWSLKEKKVDVFQNKMTILGTGGAALSIIARCFRWRERNRRLQQEKRGL